MSKLKILMCDISQIYLWLSSKCEEITKTNQVVTKLKKNSKCVNSYFDKVQKLKSWQNLETQIETKI